MRLTLLTVPGAVLLAATSLTAAERSAPLIDAIKRADTTAVRSLLQQHADLNAAEPDGTTALHWAAQRNNLEIADLLIRAGANAKVANRYGVTPLFLASENGNARLIEQLLRAGADPNSVSGEGETALMTASRTGVADAVKVLLAHGANVNATESWRGQTALMWAAMENNGAAARALIEAGAEVAARSKGGFTPLLFAARGGHLGAAEALLAGGANANETLPDGTSALVVAVTNAHYEFAAWMLDKGADPKAAHQGWTALHQLVWTRRPNMGQIPMQAPVATGSMSSLELARHLIKHGADPNARQEKDPNDGYRNLLDRKGATPFLLAAKAADVELMRVLVEGGADPLLATADKTTPLMAAAGVGIWAVGESPGENDEALAAAEYALELGGKVTDVNDYGYTAMHGAAHRGANDLIQFLADRGARLDLPLKKTGGGPLGWKEGWTPLAIAEGLFYANTFKRQPETAALIRRLMAERGVTPPTPTPTVAQIIGSGTSEQTPR